MKTRDFLVYFTIAILLMNCQNKSEKHKLVFKSSEEINVDGNAKENPWKKAQWFYIDQVWLGKVINTSDFSGRYKLSWTKEALYILVEIKDDILRDVFENPLERWWDEDCVEIFIDEDNSGGDHQFNHNAFAYHIDTKGNVVDIIAKDTPKLFNNHIVSKRITVGDISTLEFKISLFPETFLYGKTNSPLELQKNKKIGFAIAYCDNNTSDQRENFIGSVIVEGEDKDRGWKDASIFETI